MAKTSQASKTLMPSRTSRRGARTTSDAVDDAADDARGVAVSTLAEVGPVDDDIDEHDAEVLSEEPEYDTTRAEVLSEEPENDTTRADRLPPPRFFAQAAVCMRRAAVNVVALTVLCIAIGTVGLVHVSLRLGENSAAAIVDEAAALLEANASLAWSLVDCGGYICRPRVASVLGLSGCITLDASAASAA